MATILNLDKKGTLLIQDNNLNSVLYSLIKRLTEYAVCFFVSDPLLETQQHAGAQEGHVHIRIQQRNGRKTLTTVQGLSDDYDKKKIVRVCKKVRGTRH